MPSLFVLQSRRVALDVAGSQVNLLHSAHGHDQMHSGAAKRARRVSIKGDSMDSTVSALATAIGANANATGVELTASTVAPLPRIAKTEAERMVIAEALGRNFVFAALTPEEKAVIIDAMERVTVPAGGVLIEQGDKTGDRCYVVEAGELDIVVNGARVGSLGPGQLCGTCCYGVYSTRVSCLSMRVRR